MATAKPTSTVSCKNCLCHSHIPHPRWPSYCRWGTLFSACQKLDNPAALSPEDRLRVVKGHMPSKSYLVLQKNDQL